MYSFRGADVFTYQQARSDTQKQFTLDINYRSSEAFIDVVNRLFAYNRDAFVIEKLIEFTETGRDKKTEKKLTEDGRETEPLVSWIYPASDKPIAKAAATEYFARICAEEIEQILRQQTLLIDDKPVQAGDLTILVKTGRQASLMKQQLSERGISSALVLRDSVFATEQAWEISLLLEVLIEPSDNRRLNGLLSTDLFGWNASRIEQLQRDNEQQVALLDQMKNYQIHWQQKGILSMFFLLLQQQQSVPRNSAHMEGERRITNWLHIVELLQQQASEHASPSQALHWLRTQRQSVQQAGDNEEHQLRLESDRNLVRIVTIHKSKGLEYSIVFLPFMWDVKGKRNQPNSYSVHNDDGSKHTLIYDESERDRWYQEILAEEVRLFYVAMTRARYRCYLAWGNIKGAGSSAIAQCLFADRINKKSYPWDLDIEYPSALLQPFENINQGGERIKIIQPAIEQAETKKPAIKNLRLTHALPFDRSIERQWRISSYSQIASSGSAHKVDRPDYDALSAQAVEQKPIAAEEIHNRFTFPKGARAGTFLHDILEHSVFDRPVDELLIAEKCREYGYAQDWVKELVNWMQDVLDCELNGFSLSDIKPQQKITEMEFYLSSQNLNHQTLNLVLQQFHYLRPQQQYNFSDIKGFLLGFIDLVFEHQGKYYIADYKSNYLGAEKGDYVHQQCDEAMHEHHYHLQYLIYTLALHRFLGQRLQDYDYDNHIGGAYYLFLRGMTVQNNETSSGVFFHKPGRQVIEQLDDLF